MLFMVPEEDEAQPQGRQARRRAATSSVKVELDLDNAPFLEDEAPPPPPKPKPAAEPAAPKQSAESKPGFKEKLAAFLSNKKRLAIIGGGLLLLLLAPLVLTLLLQEKTPPQQVERIIVPDEAPREDAPPGPSFVYKADQFLVPVRGSEGELRFLRCRFSVPTDNQALYVELMTKNIAIRDAIFYYFSNKPLLFLSDPGSSYSLKQDLISVINENVSAEKINELFIEEYLVTGL